MFWKHLTFLNQLFRINLPAEIESTEDDSCQWDAEKGCYNLRVAKRTVGEHFEGLDMITSLLAAPKATKATKAKIEVVDSETQAEIDEENFTLDEDDSYLEQKLPEITISAHKYGFNCSYSNVLEKFQDEVWQLIDLTNPGQTSPQQRRQFRLEREQLDFEEEHYLSDLHDDPETIDRLIRFQASWQPTDADTETKDANDTNDNLVVDQKLCKFSSDEIFQLKNLPKKEFCLDQHEKRVLLYGLVDILFAYAYDQRINEQDSCSESAWNICKLSSTLSWFDAFTSIQVVLVSCCRRSLCYPLYRHFGLTRKVVQDVVCILKLGPVFVIKCLLQVRHVLNEYGDFKYLLNDLYVTDYCVWLQTVHSKYFEQVADLLQRRLNELDKEMINLDILLIEKAAQLALQEECLRKGLENISLH